VSTCAAVLHSKIMTAGSCMAEIMWSGTRQDSSPR